MSTVATSEPAMAPPSASPLYRFTVAQFDQMLRDGTIKPGERVELIDGAVRTKMPKNPPHIMVGKLLQEALRVVIPSGWHVCKEDDVVISDHDRNQPDVAVVRGTARDYPKDHATSADIALATEISESTLASDRSIKAPRYALANIPVYWIVNIREEQVEVYTNPEGDRYTNRAVFKRGQEVPVMIGGQEVGRIAVSDILP